eukprot:Skav216947  [mRNA]  locus=scaffold3396:193301:197611:+ [translate_table: standard]
MLSPGRHSFYDFKVTFDGDIVFLCPGSESWHCQVSDRTELSHEVLELCAGMGGMGVGSMFLGGLPKVAVDHNALAADHLRRNAHGQVLQLDLTAPDSAKAIHQSFGGTPGTTTMGFPCQPFSSQGLQRGMNDPRAGVFHAGLRVIYLTQSQTAILECVPAAGRDPTIQAALGDLATAMDLTVLSVNLDLAEQWPCRRARWWALLLPKAWNCIGMDAWRPASSYRLVGDVFKCWGAWNEPDETALQLYDYELEAYTNPLYGNDCRLLDFGATASTILHSYGNALSPCPCGCRAAGFSEGSLRLKGLRGYFVQSQVHGNPRYLHPREAALLLGLPDSIDHAVAPRDALALLGLVASPLQMIWVYGHLRYNEARARGLASPHPTEWLRSYQHELLRQTAQVFGTPSDAPPQILILRDAQGDELLVASPCAVTVAQLLRAQRITLEWNEAGGVSLQGQALALDQVMDQFTGPYHLTSNIGLQERPKPLGIFILGIVHEGHLHVVSVDCGQFLFQALRELGLHDVNFLVDAEGKVYGADFRVWRTLHLTTLPPTRWPPRLPTLRAAGDDSLCRGLDDTQIWHWLNEMCDALCGDCRPLLVHPREADLLLRSGRSELWGDRFSLSMGDQVLCIFAWERHWTLLHGLVCADEIAWSHCDGIQQATPQAVMMLTALLTQSFGFEHWTLQAQRLYHQHDLFSCGTIALLHAAAVLGLYGQVQPVDILRLHTVLHGFQQPVQKEEPLVAFGPDLQAQLAALLVTKGVPGNVAADRAGAALQKLGGHAVQFALRQKNPWQALKVQSSKPGSYFQFVLKEELQQYIDQKAKTRHGATISQAKKERKNAKRPSPSTWQLDPSLLDINAKHFIDSDEDFVPQITMDQVVADARGLAICSLQEAIPYVRETKNISTDALGLLIIEEVPTDVRGQANITSLRFPVTFRPTQDPLLISGCLLQLGDTEISRRVQEDPMDDMDIGTTQVLKLQVYRDEVTADWSAIAASPIRYLVQQIPLLKLCTTLHCKHDCGHFHASVEEPIDNVLHEVWGRRFQTVEGKTVPADQAELFHAFLRVAKAAVPQLVPLLLDGIYLEPRCDESRGTDPGYAVVWIPGATREIAMHKLKMCTHGVSLVRMKHRFGIRTHASYEQTTYKEIRPGEDFQKVDIKHIYRIHPVPHGLQRAQIVKLLKEWGWDARPLQPSRGTSDGGAWDIGAAEQPPHNALPAFGHDVLITLLKDKQVKDKQVTVLGPRRVQKHIQNQAPSSGARGSRDPWQEGQDPWGGWVPTMPPAPASTVVGPSKRMDALTTQLKSEVQATVQQIQSTATSSNPQQEARFLRLETGLTELRSQGQKFHTWFEETGQRLATQDQTLHSLQAQLQQQHTDIASVRDEVHATGEALSKAMTTSLNGIKNDITTDVGHHMTQQMDRFEKMLFAKLPRTDGHSGSASAGH